MRVEIIKIFKAPTFRELFDLIEAEVAELGDKDELLLGLRDWWSEEKEVSEGALAFYVKTAN